MPSISKTDCCVDKSILALLSAYQEYLVTVKLMTSQVVQRARLLRTRLCAVVSQRVKGHFVPLLSVKLPLISTRKPSKREFMTDFDGFLMMSGWMDNQTGKLGQAFRQKPVPSRFQTRKGRRHRRETRPSLGQVSRL